MRELVKTKLALLAILIVSALAAIFGQGLTPPGPPGPTMKTLQQIEPRIPISSLPVTIAAPGSYYLTSDLFGVGGQNGIRITSSFVTVDLNGFSVIGGPGTLKGIEAAFAGTKQIVIRNGFIRDWGGTGLAAALVSEARIEGVRTYNNAGGGIQVGLRSLVRDCSADGNTGNGIVADASSIVSGSTGTSNTQAGIVAGPNATVENWHRRQ